MRKIILILAIMVMTIMAWAQPAGSTVENPYPISLPLVNFTGDTSLYGSDYQGTWVTPAFNYINGDDMVLSFTLTEARYISGTLASPMSWFGLCFVDQSPNPTTPAPVLHSANSTSAGTLTIPGKVFQPGTYYIILGTWPSPQSMTFTLNLNSDEVTAPLSGNYTINPANPTGGTNFQTFTAVVNALNLSGISGSVTFNVPAGAVFTEEVPVITATGTSSSTITFVKSGTGANPVIKPTTSQAGITIQGGDYFTFDGIDVMVNSGSTPNYGYYLMAASATNGAQYNTIKNCTITLNKTNTSTKGVYQYYSVTPTSTAGANSHNKYQNITVESSTTGFYVYGYSSTYPDLNNEISGCTIGGATADDMAGNATGYGVYANYQSGIQIFNNEIRNFTTSYSYGNTYGVYLTNCYGINAIHSNKIHDLKSSVSSTYAQYGIYASLGSSTTNAVNIYNNMLWNISSGYTGTGTTSYLVYGIYLSGSTVTNTYNVDFNSIRIVGPTTAYSAGVYFSSNTAKNNLRNNIIANYTGAQTTYKHVGVYFSNATTIGAAGSVSDRNVIYIDNSTNGFVVRGSSTDYANLAAWTGASTQDSNSKTGNPQFTSATNLYIRTDAPTPVEGNGSFFDGAISWVPNDIDGARTVRNTETPDIGAHEGDFMREQECETPGAQAINLVLVPGTTTISGSFTASDAEAYLVVRHTESEHNDVPRDGTFYTAGNSIGNGTVVQAATGITFIATGLTVDTEYFFTIYAYNSNGMNAPKYLGDGPLIGSMQTLPAVPANPGSATATAVSSNQIDIASTANANNDNVIIAWNTTNTFGTPLATGYSVDDEIAGGGTVLYMGPAGTFNHTPLSSSTIYYYKVWSYITADRTTYYGYSTGLTADARTFAATITDFPYTQGFENGGVMPADWTVTAGAGASRYWECVTTDADHGASAPVSGSYFARLYVFLSSATYNPYCLVSPPLDLSGTGKRLKFWAWIGAAGHATPLDVQISTDNQQSWTTLDSYTNTANTNAWNQYTIQLTAYNSNQAFIRFKATSNYGSGMCDLGLDDIVVENLPATLEPNFLTATNITAAYADLGWTEINTPPATQWDIIFGAPGFDPATEGTLKSGVTSNPYRLTDLTPSTTYHWYVRSVNSSNAVSAWAGPGTFTTTQILATLPFSEGFESWPNNWTVVNGTQTNQWHVGTATYHTGEKSAYISNDGGTTNYYNTSSTSTVHLYRDIAFTADSKKFDLKFWWKGYGEGATYFYDYLRVFLVDPSVTPVAGTLLSSDQIGSTYNLQDDWTQASIELPGTLSGATKRLVFTWRNDGSTGTQAPIAIDDILLTATPFPTTPVFAIDPDFMDFGNQQIGTSSDEQIFTIQNEGVGDLIIGQAISLVGDNPDQFELTDLNSYPYTVNSEHPMLQVSVAFKPTSVGQKSAKLRIVDNITREVREIELTGNGVDSTIREIPYIQTWDVPDLIEGWVVYNLNGDANTWSITSDGGSSVAYIVYTTSAMNDWLISPPIILNAGTTYTVSYRFRCYSSSYPEKMKVAFGNDQNPIAMTEIIADHPNIANTTYVGYSANFTPETTGPWYLGFHGYSNADMWNLYLDDIRILLPNTQVAQVTANGPNASVTLPEITVGGQQISPEVAFEGLSGNPVITVSASCGPTSNPLTNERLVLNIDGGNLAGVKVTFTHGLGFIPSVLAYQIGAGGTVLEHNPGDWTDTTAYFTVPSLKGPSDLKVIFPKDGSDTLPITLSSFTAVLTADLHVKIAWIAESETDHAGYNLLRSEVDKLATAIRINSALINQGEENGSQIAYSYTDSEVYPASTYYYWLESQSLNGETDYYGPLQVQILAQDEEQELPVIPMETKLYSAFPNPFNPTTNLRYSMKEAGEVMIQVYNVKGQLLKTFHNQHDAPGYYQVSWDGRDARGKSLSTGVYFYRMTSGKYSATKKMVLSK